VGNLRDRIERIEQALAEEPEDIIIIVGCATQDDMYLSIAGGTTAGSALSRMVHKVIRA
jgi:hypothetical protein